jgi:hypothetical protein
VTASTDEDTAVAVGLVGTDADGDALTYAVIDAPTTGTVSISGATATYTPGADFSGSDSFTYQASDGALLSNIATVTLSVASVNDAPVVIALDAVTAEDTSVDVVLSGSDADGDALTYSVDASPAHGTVSLTGATVTYVPAADYNGADSFTYTANDGQVSSAPATVSIVVSPVNDAPVFGVMTGDVVVREDGSLDLAFPASDVDGDVLTWSIVSSAPWIGIDADNGMVSGDPAGHAGMHTFTVTVSDGIESVSTASVMVTVLPVSAYATGLSGVHETPAVSTPGTGYVVVQVIEDEDRLEVYGTFEQLSAGITGAHIHLAPVGVAGAVMIPLTATSTDGRSGYFDNTFTLSGLTFPAGVTLASFLDDLDNGNAYVNIHTSAYPAGEIRGQILASDNHAPAATEIRGPSSVVVAGNPDDRLLSVSWLPVSDPDGDKVNYLFQLSLGANFSNTVVTESFGDGNGFRLTVAEAAQLFDDLTDRNPGNIAIGDALPIYYRIITSDGWLWTAGDAGMLTLTRGLITANEPTSEIPTEFALHGNYPNPFNPSTTITFDLPATSEVSVQILDILGREVASMPVRTLDAGIGRSIDFSADGLQSGIYFYRVIARSQATSVVRTGTMTLVK